MNKVVQSIKDEFSSANAGDWVFYVGMAVTALGFVALAILKLNDDVLKARVMDQPPSVLSQELPLRQVAPLPPR